MACDPAAIDCGSRRLSSGLSKALAFQQLELLQGVLHRRAAPERLDHTQDDPHAVRRLRDRPWLVIGEEMRPLKHALLRGSLPGAALERGRPRHALQED